MAEFFGFDTLARLKCYNPGFGGATLSGGRLDTDGNVILNEASTIAQTTDDNYNETIDNTHWVSQSFTTTGTVIDLSGEINILRIGNPGNLTLAIKADDGTGKPTGADIATGTIAQSSVGTTKSYVSFTILGANLSANTKYHLIAKALSGDGSNAYFGYRSNSDTYSGGSVATTADSGSTWTVGTTKDFCFQNLLVSSTTTSGTVTVDISVESLHQWYKYHRSVTTPANTVITCAIKDTSNNVLIASVSDGDSLSTIDATTYKTIRVVHTLTRNSTDDDTPKLHYREVSWIGQNKYIPTAFSIGKFQGSINQASGYQVVENITGKGKLKQLNFCCGGLNDNAYIKITKDGVVLYDGAVHTAAVTAARKAFNYAGTETDVHLLFDLKFDISLKVEVKNNSVTAYASSAMTVSELE